MDYLCVCFNAEDLANYDVIKLIATSPAILEQMIVTKQLFIVDFTLYQNLLHILNHQTLKICK